MRTHLTAHSIGYRPCATLNLGQSEKCQTTLTAVNPLLSSSKSTMSSTKLDDFFKVPRLEVDGTNWVIYKDHLQWAADACGYLSHLNGNQTVPTAPAIADPATPMATETAALAAYAYDTAHADWIKGEAVIKQMIASTIPDSLFMKICSKTTTLAIWTALANVFQSKSHMVVIDL